MCVSNIYEIIYPYHYNYIILANTYIIVILQTYMQLVRVYINYTDNYITTRL